MSAQPLCLPFVDPFSVEILVSERVRSRLEEATQQAGDKGTVSPPPAQTGGPADISGPSLSETSPVTSDHEGEMDAMAE